MLPTTITPSDRSAFVPRVNPRALTHPYAPVPSISNLPVMMPHPLLHHQLHCRYRSKLCLNVRARKRDGSLHRYCEEHRQRANTNQKKWAQRRLQILDGAESLAVHLPPLHETYDLEGMEATQSHGEWTLPPLISSEHDHNNSQLCVTEEDQQDYSPLFTEEYDYEQLWQDLGFDDDVVGGQ